MTGEVQTEGAVLDGYMDKAEAAEALRVKPRTLDRWHLKRRGPPRTKVGGRV